MSEIEKLITYAENRRDEAHDHDAYDIATIRYWVGYIDGLRAVKKAQQADITRLRKALANMRFAYINKDGDFPHGFEKEAMKEANEIIGELQKGGLNKK